MESANGSGGRAGHGEGAVYDRGHAAWSAGRTIGCVDGSQLASTQEFTVALSSGEAVGLDDILVSSQRMPDGGLFTHYGIVAEASTHYEGASFASDSGRMGGHPPPGSPGGSAEEGTIQPRTMVGNPMTCLSVKILRTDPEEITLPPAPGAAVRRATDAERDYALYATDMPAGRLPVGLDLHGGPVFADFRFVNGSLGGHVSISGISGVATKTSYALFLLHQLFETAVGRTLLGEHLSDTRALVFNVKGEDLLHVDRANAHFEDEAREAFRRLGAENPHPFTSVRFFAPISRRSTGASVIVDVESRAQEHLSPFGFAPREFVEEGLLEYAMEDEGGRNQVEWVREAVIPELMRHASPSADEEGAIVLAHQPQGSSAASDIEVLAGEFANRTPRRRGEGDFIGNFSDLVEHLAARLDADANDSHQPTGVRLPMWSVGGAADATKMAFIRRLYALRGRLGHLVSSRARSVELSEARVNVVDIHGLHADAQRFVVGVLLEREFRAKEGRGRNPLRFVVLDELNKYAPRHGSSPIKTLLKDIAERGRSLGVLLIGAQQSAKDVEEALVRNSSLKVVGRLDASDASDYRFLGSEMQARASRIMPGTMIFSHPPVPVPVPIRFPIAPYATNQSDVLRDAAVPSGDGRTGGGFLSEEV